MTGSVRRLNEADHDMAVALAKHINDLLIGVRTDVAMWALGYSGAVAALHTQRANPNVETAGLEILAQIETIGRGEFHAQIIDMMENLENG